MQVKRLLIGVMVTCITLSALVFLLIGHWHVFHTRAFSNTENAANLYGDVIVQFYQSKSADKISRWITFLDEKRLADIEQEFATTATFYAVIFKQYPEQIEQWLGIIDSLSSEGNKKVFWAALWLSTDPKGKEYLKKRAELATPDNKLWLEEMLKQSPPDLINLQPSTPEENDMQWSSFFASGNQKYIVNLIDAACFYDEQDDYLKFITATTAKWSLALSAEQHFPVERALKRELDKRHGLEKKVIQEILNRSQLPNGPEIFLIEAEKVIQEQQSKGHWLGQ